MEPRAATAFLQRRYKFSEFCARALLRDAREAGHSLHGNPAGKGHVLITFDGRQYNVEIYRMKSPATLAQSSRMDYSRGNAKPLTNQRKRARAMPPRGKRAAQAAVEEPEEAVEAEEGGEFDHHLTKTLSPTMSDYGDWFHENVTDIDELGKNDPGRLLALGSTLYPHFQKSELNQTRRAARKQERSAAATAEEEAPAPARAKPAAPRGKAAAPAKPARGRGKAATVEAY